MPSKKITIAPKPDSAATADNWVSGASNAPEEASAPAETSTEAVAFKRLTIDVPEELHTRIKSQCALRRVKMADEIRTLLETHFPA